MKSLIESLFDTNLVEKSVFDNTEFKKWINQPNILWHIYYYWESGEEDWLDDFAIDGWAVYKPLVDKLLDIIDKFSKKIMGRNKYTWYMINFDSFDNDDDIRDIFTDDGQEEFETLMNDANYEIIKKSSEEHDGIWKTKFKGPLPKHSDVTDLLKELELPFTEPGKIDGGIFLTNEDNIMILGFPKGIPGDVLKLFDIL